MMSLSLCVAPEMSVLDPAGPAASEELSLFNVFVVVSIVVFVVVIAALVFALIARKEPKEQSKKRIVGIATAITVTTLIALLILSVQSGKAMASIARASGEPPLPIEITGHRWWWEIRYPDEATPSNAIKTAYEVHVPVGRRIELRLQSNDVIHSFWVPSLGPKRDLIPGKRSTLVLIADREGIYDGMCAEFCGMQHANMRLRIVAERKERFVEWQAHMRTPAVIPDTEQKKHGQAIFEAQQCGACHSVTGTNAFASVGPDLTHFASRSRLAMGTLPNTNEAVRRWIDQPHADKPGVIMPAVDLPPQDLDALVMWLRSLQ